MRADLTSPQAFESLIREHQSMVFRTLSRMTGAGPHVEDLAQEVFLRLYRALPEFRGDSALTTYLYRIVVNVAQDEWKRRRRDREFVATAPAASTDDEAAEWLENMPGDSLHGHARNPEQLLSDAQLQEAVDTALLSLSEAERAVLILYHQEDCTYEAISAALDMPIGTVRTHLHRGRKRMSALIQAQLAPSKPVPPPTRYPQPMEAR
jgi:RNA polymerase sigma-70 factor (ECF subfamily)